MGAIFYGRGPFDSTDQTGSDDLFSLKLSYIISNNGEIYVFLSETERQRALGAAQFDTLKQFSSEKTFSGSLSHK